MKRWSMTATSKPSCKKGGGGDAPPTAMDLKIDALTHRYGMTEVLADINLDIPTGRIVCVVGPSGCGKSTLLRFIGGLERPTNGQVLQLSEPPADSLNPFTFVFQDFALLPWRTVDGNVRLVLEDHGLGKPEMDRIITDVLMRTKLADFADALPKNLSGGMKQRVAIARALAVRPAVWLMDEPLSALDAQTRELLMDDLVGLWLRTPFTAVYVTHNLAEAVRLGHRIVVLSRRPGMVRKVIDINTPLENRTAGDPALAAIEQELWQLMRDEAEAADQELIA